jgi:hypothetical protein
MSPSFPAVINKLRGATKTIKVITEGGITLEPLLHGCTQTTICASVSIEPSPAELARVQPVTEEQLAEDDDDSEAPEPAALSSSFVKKLSSHLSTSRSALPPSKHADVYLKHIVVSAVTSLRQRFDRSKEVDAARLNHFEKIEILEAPSITREEEEFIFDEVTKFDLREGVEGERHRIRGTVQDSVSYHQQFQGKQGAIGEAGAVIDASPGRVFAEIWCVNTNERINQHIKKRRAKVLRKAVHIPGSRSMLTALVIPLGIALADRIFFTWFTWKEDGMGGFVVAFAAAERCPESKHVRAMKALISGDAKAASAVRGISEGLWRISRLAENVCRVKYIVQANMGGERRAPPTARTASSRSCFLFNLINTLAHPYTLPPFFFTAGSIPKWLLNLRVKSTLGALSDYQVKFQRNGRLVDEEIREAFPTPPKLDGLSSEQRALVIKCRGLEKVRRKATRNSVTGTIDGSAEHEWIDLVTLSPFVKMRMKHTPPENDGRRAVALGNAEAIIDCPPKAAALWLLSYCSRERMRIDKEEGNLARLVFEETSLHDVTVATVKRMPFPLHHREFVGRQLLTLEVETGDFLLCAQSVDAECDYGANFRTVRGTITAFVRISSLGDTQCKVVLYQYLDAGGVVPVKIMESKIPMLLSVMVDLREEFQRDDDVDKKNLDEMARVIRDEPQNYSDGELELLKRVHDSIGSLPDAGFQQLESTDHLVEMFWSNEGAHAGVGKAITVIDASPEECASWAVSLMSRESLRVHAGKRGLERSLIAVNSHNNLYHVVYQGGFVGVQPREWVQTQIWKKDGEDRLEIFSDSIEHADFPRSNKYVRALSRLLVLYDKLPSANGVTQTKVTLVQRIDLAGALPRKVVNSISITALMELSRVRTRFDRSLEIDAANRVRNIAMFESHSTAYSDEESKMIDGELGNVAMFENSDAKKTNAPSPTIENSVMFKPGQILGVGRSVTTVRASKEQVLGFFWDSSARCRWGGSDSVRSILETKNDHHCIAYVCKRNGTHGVRLKLLPREGVNVHMWRREADESFVFVGIPTEHDLVEHIPAERVRATMPSCIIIKETSPGECRVVYVNQLNLGGAVPFWVMNHYMVMNLSLTHRVQSYFQELRTLEEYDTADGKALGIRLMFPGGPKNKKRWELLDEIVGAHAGLREMAKKYPWLKAFLVEIVKGQMAFAASVSTKLDCLSVLEARTIGRSLAPALRQRKTAGAGLYQWKLQNKSMIELFEKYPWTEDMLLAIALEVVKTAPWGLAWRVSTGAFLSVLDIVTDINMILLYVSTQGQENLGYTLLAMFVACIFIQLIVVIGQNWKKKERLPGEIFVVLIGMKAPWDAKNVVRGKAQEEHTVVDAKTELVFSKGAELL